ncbi:MAG: DUF2165 domain-containing protein [Beijerinckiaceae bacterium]|nr:DUF2165 domain-containing protein [Beijerinckiaceae bacterium]MCI0736506.1 DUF2165 domain-containing protein [Beijerinckiaceae bacterium]
MLAIRLAKILCAAAIAFYMALVVFNNVTDYWTNFAFVVDVLDIEQVSPRSDIHWRAITSPALHHAAYALIILTELIISALTFAGALAMGRARKASAKEFDYAKAKAVAGLALGFLLFEGGFVAVGGEWFGMWQSASYDAVPSAFRILVTMLGVLIFISLKDEELA